MKHPKSFDTTPEIRRRMSSVKLKNGKAEVLLAKCLWHRGFRYRKNCKKLPGSPDIAILKYNIAVFIDGEFWHGKDWQIKKERLNKNREYWIEKIEENIDRDRRDNEYLEAIGWRVIRFWEKDVLHDVTQCLSEIEELAYDDLIEE